jgi:hypothetical protein
VHSYFTKRKLRRASSYGNEVNTDRNVALTRHFRNSIKGLFGVAADRSPNQTAPPQARDATQEDDHTITSSGQESTVARAKYLQLCISRQRLFTDTSYTSHDLNVESDERLYHLLRAQYRSLIGPWRRFISLRRICEIRFVKVGLHPPFDDVGSLGNQFRLRRHKLATVETHSGMENRIRDSLPGANDDDYGFDPPQPAFLPPIGHNEMMHYFYHPCKGQDDDLHIRRFPGHKLNPVPFQPDEDEKYVWGIELVESRQWMFLSIPVFLIISGSMCFGVCWAAAMRDVQGGFTIAGYIVSSGLSLLVAIQVVFEST